MLELILILENETDTDYHPFSSTDGMEQYLKTIDLSEYCRTNILFKIDGELNWEIMKMYKKKYL